MLTTLSLSVQDPFPAENYGPGGTLAELYRYDGDFSQPLVVSLASSDDSEVTIPESVTIPAFESSVTFPVDLVDDTLLDGEQLVVLTAAAGLDSADAYMLVQDYEEAAITFDQTALSPGDTLTGTVTVTVTGHTEPLSVPIVTTRPDEIASFVVEIPVGEQSANFAIPVTSDDLAEGPHAVQIAIPYDFGLYMSSLFYVSVADAGVTTLQPVDDGHARDADQDGLVFEQLTLNSTLVTSQPASPSGSFGEARGIVEFDVTAIPAGAIIQSAVLTLDVGGTIHTAGNNIVMDAFAYPGNGLVESADANEANNFVGQLVVPTDVDFILRSYAVPLDIADIQSLIGGGSHLGITTKMQLGSLSFYSREFFRQYSRPSLHLVLAYPPALTTNTLTLNEGETIALTADNLAAADPDSEDDALTFTVTNVTAGQFLVAGSPATSFTQAQLVAGQVAFAHDGSETAPTFTVEVSDGTYSDGPQPATISFSHVNDNAPVIPAGQSFSVSEDAPNGTPVGSIVFSDDDLPGDSFAVSIVAGNDDGVFGIDNAGNLFIAENSNLDFESASSYALSIRVFDGANATDQDVTVNLLDVAETKFYVVDDASTNRTYEYTDLGATIENYALNSANTAPRGAASTAAGDRVWVVDANRKVYVYDASGGLLGSWTAGTMSSTATPEGIATDGTHVWIVDAKSDKVFKYSGAANRLSGSQNAGSSFNLNSANRSPKDIVTDGASLWVVNDTTTDKVFKYTTAGSLLGSWTIASANSKPTGLTIDPTNVSDIWIVDSGTDQVYQYVDATSRTSGSQGAAAMFALAAGNDNPQAIADPPPATVRRATNGPSVEPVHPAVQGAHTASLAVQFAPSRDKAASAGKRRIALAREKVFDSMARTPNDVLAPRANWRDNFLDESDAEHILPIPAGEHAAADDALASILDGGGAHWWYR